MSHHLETDAAILIGALVAWAVFFLVQAYVLKNGKTKIPAQAGFALANIVASVPLSAGRPLAAVTLLNAGFLMLAHILLVKIKSGKAKGGENG